MSAQPSMLERILAHKREEIDERRARHGLAQLRELAAEQPGARGFAQSIKSRASRRETAVIAEIKRASPSKGTLRESFDPIAIARGYQAAGAACVSVVTDTRFFRGSGAILDLVRRHCALPVLRKDFIMDPYQIYESKALGADALLLIAAALPDDGLMRELFALAIELGMDVLAEVHDETELGRALALGADLELIGVNNRDLTTFETSLDTSLRMAPGVPDDKIVVAESGIRCGADLRRLRDGAIHACLIGETLMTADDPGAKLQSLLADAAR